MEFHAKTRKEIALEYRVDVKTFQRWCEKHGIELKKRDRVLPKTIQQIYAAFGCLITPDDGMK